ncbi:MAG: ChbG/HpnK family deacetylase [Planctomycetota bacterium]|jgi:predicted glycoside hydrolase/deacetylase ChbG (UPF0249 family)|nr:ChbG/HpnK family deacetylase [Planctomycetota bacterium]
MAYALITRGDDAGVSRSAHAAIAQCATVGILRNASLMAPGPACHDAVEVLRLVPGLCLGLHFTLTCEWDWPRFGPPAGFNWLDADGGFPHRCESLTERAAPIEELVGELSRQLDLVTSLGADIRYIDQHMGVGWIPGLGEAIRAFCQRKGLIDGDAHAHLRRPQAQDYPASMCALLDQLPDTGSGIVLGHPCLDDDEMAAFHGPGLARGSVGPDRAGQASLFTDPAVVARMEARGIVPSRYDQVA